MVYPISVGTVKAIRKAFNTTCGKPYKNRTFSQQESSILVYVNQQSLSRFSHGALQRIPRVRTSQEIPQDCLKELQHAGQLVNN